MRPISILLTFGLLSCSRITEPLPVTVTEYAIGGEIRKTEIDRLKIESTDFTKTYRYIELNLPDTHFNNLIKQDLRTDSTIFYYTEQGKLRGQMTFSFADNEYLVKRYILDSPDEDDAGAIFF